MRRIAARVLAIAALVSIQSSVWAQATMSFPASGGGTGTADDPYIISSAGDFSMLATDVNSGTSYQGVYFRLSDSFDNSTQPITEGAGDGTNDFSGVFDGNGRTLHVNLTHDNNGDAFIAPFKRILSATIRGLNIEGTITTNGKMAGGIVGDSYGESYIQNCRSSVTITSTVDGDGTHGGLVGRNNNKITISDCLFDGTITGAATHSCGGFVGWNENNLVIINCLQAGNLTGLSSTGGATFCRPGTISSDVFGTCYYRTAYGTEQGTQTSATGADLKNLLGDKWQVLGNGDVVPITDARNLILASISGINELYRYTGNDIEVTCKVKDANGNQLTEGTHYTASISPAKVKDLGTYTLTITAKEGNAAGYTGSKSISFVVVSWLTEIGGFCGDQSVNGGMDVYYEFADNTLTIKGTGAMADYDNSNNKSPWRTWRNNNYKIKQVVIGSGVTTIGKDAFHSTDVEIVTFMEGSQLTAIGDGAFSFCKQLKNFTIPAGVTYIGNDAFYRSDKITDVYCHADPTKLTWNESGCNDFIYSRKTLCHVNNAAEWSSFESAVNVTFVGGYCGNPGANGGRNLCWDLKFDDYDKKTLIIFKNPDAVGTDFSMADNVSFSVKDYNIISIEDGVSSIGANSFKDFTKMEYVIIPASVTDIESGAFQNCSLLSSIIVLAGTPPTLGSDPFTGIKDNAVFTVRNSSYQTTAGWVALRESYTMNVPDAACFDIAYIDADGKQAVCPYAVPITGGADVSMFKYDIVWYNVSGDVTISGNLIFNTQRECHIILCDGAILTVENISSNDHLNIYAQTNGTGAINISESFIYSYGGLTVNGGHITVIDALSSQNDITINGGHITINQVIQNNNGIYSSQGNIIINGGNITINGIGNNMSGILALYGDIIINGGQITAHEKNNNDQGASMCSYTGDLIINGGSIIDDTHYGIQAKNNMTLGYTDWDDHICTNEYTTILGSVRIKTGQEFIYDDGTEFVFISGTITDLSAIKGKDLMAPYIVLADNDDNTDKINKGQGAGRNVVLQGRTLYKDGYWNTLCLPFAIDDLTATPLEGAELMELDIVDNGTYTHATGLDGTTLYLNFKAATSIEAGKPYIIKWASGTDIVNPVFTGVTIDNSAETLARKTVSFTGGSFVGSYSPLDIDNNNINEIIYLGGGNTIGYASAARTLHSCRAHFEIPAGGGSQVVTRGVINYSDGTTEVFRISDDIPERAHSDMWYDILGRKLDDRPTAKGMYINNGRKILITE